MSENPYQPPREVTDSVVPRRWPYLGWLAPVVTWVPALLLLGLVAPKFSELFDSLRERAELPQVSSLVLAAARFSLSLFHIPIGLFLAGLVAGDLAVCDFAKRRGTRWPHTAWQTAICTGGMIAALLIVISLLLPIIGTSRLR